MFYVNCGGLSFDSVRCGPGGTKDCAGAGAGGPASVLPRLRSEATDGPMRIPLNKIGNISLSRRRIP